ncbi:hypothetical protein CGGC5_v001140 [Colletotrichum fructicola Nara gc5]|uniref:Uncharacterized protein n=2 Tax=Colletotrichum fructicola (strain Nara gc5) TaxID=1213859 RepID=A0A7J6JQB0_COLFN|nr:hypothetical protein CGGC5_v001140 [Colletotrichum fructicola Nara gc5]
MTCSTYTARLCLLISLFPTFGMQQTQQAININSSSLYPYYPEEWMYAQVGRLNLTFADFMEPLKVPFDLALFTFLLTAGNFTENCTLATSWYYSHNLQAGGHANFSFDFGTSQDKDFVSLVAPLLIDSYESALSKIVDSSVDPELYSYIIYELLANSTKPVDNAVFNITRPAIETHCLSLDLAEEFAWQPQNDCNTALSQWLVPGLEWLDVMLNIQAAFTALPAEYKSISIQTFWGWYNLQTNSSTANDIKTRKRECYQEVCSELQTSGNPDIAGIGMFISYIIASILATLVILQTYWHNWKHRRTPLESLSSDNTEASFVKVANTFLNTGIVLLLSLAVSLVAVASHETILYNGIITHVACYFTASATIAVASMPRRGSDRDSTFWFILLFATLLSTISMNLAGQYDVEFDSPALELADTVSDNFDSLDSLLDLQYLGFIPYLNYSTGASEYPGIQSSRPFTASTNFTAASCLIWSFLYQQGSISYITTYLPFSLYVQEITYFFGILVLFILTRIT